MLTNGYEFSKLNGVLKNTGFTEDQVEYALGKLEDERQASVAQDQTSTESQEVLRADGPSDSNDRTASIKQARKLLGPEGNDLSPKELTERLVSGGYSWGDSIYAAYNCGADWDAQAGRRASRLLDEGKGISRLPELLMAAGFTEAQATKASEQAKKDLEEAKRTREELIRKASRELRELLAGSGDILSSSELIDWLVNKGDLTRDEASELVYDCEVDWKEQASRRARILLKRGTNVDALPDRLREIGFSSNEAHYAWVKVNQERQASGGRSKDQQPTPKETPRPKRESATPQQKPARTAANASSSTPTKHSHKWAIGLGIAAMVLVDIMATPQVQSHLTSIPTTPSQSEALSKAHELLNAYPYSRSSLVDKLEETYGSGIAEWAADNCEADWSTEAAENAHAKINSGTYSPTNLKATLISEGFTDEEAGSAVSHYSDLFDSEAAEYAESLIGNDPFTKDAMKDALTSAGFNDSQTDYALDGCDFNEEAVKYANAHPGDDSTSPSDLSSQLQNAGFSSDEADYGVSHSGIAWNDRAAAYAKACVSNGTAKYTDLVTQLRNKGYDSTQATAGTDNCGVDWNANALAAAKERLKGYSYSRSNLISWLRHEGYSKDQATYGDDSTGTDWNNEAVKCATSLKQDGKSSDDIKTELKNTYGYTDDQISYAMSKI